MLTKRINVLLADDHTAHSLTAWRNVEEGARVIVGFARYKAGERH